MLSSIFLFENLHYLIFFPVFEYYDHAGKMILCMYLHTSVYIPTVNVLSFYFIIMCLYYTDNLVENLLGDFEYEVQVPYLLYRNAAQEVNGIWFYNSRECEEVANLFTRYSIFFFPIWF